MLVNGLIGTIAEVAARTTTVELWVLAAIAGLIATLASLAYDHARLRKRHAKIETELFENTVGKESTNWTNTALNLERKAMDPGLVARSTAMTHLHMLDEAANAWLKGSQWPDALRVTQDLLREGCHTITRPSINEHDFRAASDLIKRALEKYADLSKAANEAVENATGFLTACDTTLAVLSGSALIQDLRFQIGEVHDEIAQKLDRRTRAA
jgi:hypothetical protein